MRWLTLGRRRFRELIAVVRRDRLLCTAFVVAVAIDLLFSLFFAVLRLLYNLEINQRAYADFKFLRIDAEGGLPEWFNYGQSLLLVLFLGRLFFSTRQLIYLTLTVLFGVVLLDDSLQFHERGAKFLIHHWHLHARYGLRAQDVGEQITWVLLGLLVMPLVAAGLVRARRVHLDNGLALLIAFGALVFFGMVLDQLFPILRNSFPGSDILLATAEDGGEMLSLTVACALAAALVRHGPSCGAATQPA